MLTEQVVVVVAAVVVALLQWSHLLNSKRSQPPPIYAENCQQDVNNMVQNILGAFKNLKGRPTYLCVWKAYNIWHTCAQRTSHNCHYMIHPPS